MPAEQRLFRVSTGLKDLIGRELITEDFVAVFELVKNSFDAHARNVLIHFGDDRIVITDDGKGMTRYDVLNKWMFVAYSAKRDGTEDDDYRHRIEERRRPYAGAKGVGRFSCDRLGTSLRLSTRAAGNDVQVLEVDWRRFEQDPKAEFGTIAAELSQATSFPRGVDRPPGGSGTVLEITGLRSGWERSRLGSLKRELTKLIDPFGEQASGPDERFGIEIDAPSEAADDAALSDGDDDGLKTINGPVRNPILDVINGKTTRISVELVEDGRVLETTLEDRGDLIYKIREPNSFAKIANTCFKADVYYLNRSAKTSFTRRMGLPPVQFGSIFLFRNGFRVAPIGAEDDDFFRLNQRKQQGQRRFLGGRDLIGRVQIKGVTGFAEATSRNQGLIRTPQVAQLVEAVRDKCIKRLERYVIDITWKDNFDQDQADTSRVRLDASSALVSKLVANLADTEGVEVVDYNRDLVRIIEEKSQAHDASLQSLELLAERTGDAALMARVEEARARVRALEGAEAEAREAERRAEGRAVAAEQRAATSEARYGDERARNAFLIAASSLDQDTVLNLHHQIIMQASDVHIHVKTMMRRVRRGDVIEGPQWTDFLETIAFRNSQIITTARFATKAGYKQQAADHKSDLVAYVRDYAERVSTLWAPKGISVRTEDDGTSFERTFRPIDIGILVDNLVTNAAKARATEVVFEFRVQKGPTKPRLEITVTDNGRGWPATLDRLASVFEKGVTTTDGSGLGLYHVKHVVEAMGGTVEAVAGPYSSRYSGARLTLKVPT